MKIKKWLSTLDLFIMHEGTKYPIKDFSLYHSIIGEVIPGKKMRPSGGHCNFQNMLNPIFNPIAKPTMKNGFSDVKLFNLNKKIIYKESILFPNDWTPRECVEAIVEAIKTSKISYFNLDGKSPNVAIIDYNKNFRICLNTETHCVNFFPKKF